MSYTKITDFAAKDALATGNPAKIITGTAHDNEYNAIQVADALNLKRDGTTTASANIPMGNNKFTGLSAGTTAGDSVRYEQFASPPAIGSTAPNTIAGTTVDGTTITASTNFVGPGAGLTGTAAGLSVGGNATTATTSTNIAGGSPGDIPYQSSANTTAMLAAGTAGYYLEAAGAAPPVWTASKRLGDGQTWQDLTGSRALATDYTNSTGRSIMVSVYGTSTGASQYLDLLVGGVIVAKTIGDTTNGAASASLTTVVPAGSVYRVNGTRTLAVWAELR